MIALRVSLIALFLTLTLAEKIIAKEVREISDSEDIFDLSLEELLNVTVNVASQNSENILDTPAIVSRYEMSDLAGMGLQSLVDVLRFIPGVLVEESLIGSYIVQIRGLSDSYNQKVLFLLDNVPYWMPSHADIPILGIPYESIKHIEVLRGPAAIIYGTNASAGVIKISTKNNAKKRINVRLGNENLLNLNTYLSHDFGENDVINLSAEFQKFGGYESRVNDATAPVFFTPTDSGEVKRGSEYYSAIAQYKNTNWNLLTHFFESKSRGNTTDSIVEEGQYIQKGQLFFVNRKWSLESTTIKSYLDYNRFSLELTVDNVLAILGLPGSQGGFVSADGGKDNDRFRAGLSFETKLTSASTVLSGFEFEKRRTEDFVFQDSVNGNDISLFFPEPLPEGQEVILIFPENRAQEKAVFFQLDQQYLNWRALVGARYTENSVFGSKTTPQVSIVYKFDQRRSLKFLHSEGFNSPSFSQSPEVDGLGNPVDPDLSAEEISTTELAFNFSGDNELFVANLYSIEATNLIVRNQIEGQTVNSPNRISRFGMELDYQYKSRDWTLFANFGLLKQGNSNIEQDLFSQIYPKHEAAIGTRHQLSDTQSIGTSFEYLGGRRNSDKLNLLNVNYNYRLESGVVLSLTLRNLFNDDMRAPDPRGIGLYSMQNRQPFNYYFGLLIPL